MKMLMSVFLVVSLGFLSIPVVSSSEGFQESDVAVEFEEVYENYVVTDEEGNFLTEKRGVVLGDIIIDKDFNKYEVVFVDDENLVARARFVESFEKPKIHKKKFESVSEIAGSKKLGLYCTHNDESYIIGDGIESVYGAGGIHDIALAFGEKLTKKGAEVSFNETLHIPHNSSAYSRSRATAKSLLDGGATAIFDIHRDGASRSFYLTENNGKKCSKVRLVVGQGNANSEANLQFALWLVSVAENLYPWLIADIYFGKGKYNQDLTSKAMLFEMGCHKIEKDYVMRSIDALADVVVTTLFGTTVEEESGNLTIGGVTNETSGTTVDEVLEEKNKTSVWPVVITVGSVGALILGGSMVLFRKKKFENVES